MQLPRAVPQFADPFNGRHLALAVTAISMTRIDTDALDGEKTWSNLQIPKNEAAHPEPKSDHQENKCSMAVVNKQRILRY